MKMNKIISILPLVLLLIFVGFYKVSSVSCSLEKMGEVTKCPEQLSNQINVLKGKSFFFTNFTDKISKLEETNSIYLLKSIDKKLSGEIQVTLEQETIIYLLDLENETYLLGNSGKVLPQQASETVPKIIWQNNQPILENNQVNPKYHTVLKNFTQSLSNQQIDKPINLYWTSDSEIILEIESKPDFIFDIQTLETNIKKIGTILEAREIDEIEAPIQEIDMRFELPVLRTTQ